MNRKHRISGGLRSRSLAAFTTLVGLIFLSVLPVCADYYYYITDLGTLGGTSSRAYGLNNSTPIKVTGQSLTVAGQNHAFAYKPMTDLGTLLGGTDSFGRAINNSGHVVGYATAADGKQHAFIYNPVSFPLTDLGTLGGYPCDATAINSSGQVAGSFTTTKTPVKSHPYVWNSGTGMTDLLTDPLVPVTWTSGYATGINDLGQVTGYAIDSVSNNYRAFLYTPTVGMTNLGTLGGKESQARALNASGKVVGNSRIASGLQHPFYYGGSGPLVDLGTFGGDAGYARSINSSGLVVGQTQLPGNINTPFIWSESTGKIDLATVVGNNHSSYEQWYLSDALAINDQGFIVGVGSIKTAAGDQAHGFLLTPATPVTITTTIPIPYGHVGDSYNKSFAATGGVAPYSWSITSGGLPPGLIMSSTGAITGKPTIIGNYSFTVEARDTVGLTASKEVTLYVSTVFLSDITLPNAVIGNSYGRQLAASGGTTPYTFALVGGSLPPGLLLTTDGYVRGTPTTAGSYDFTAQITDAAGVVSPPRSYPLTVVIGPLTITTATLPNPTLYTSYSRSLVATGGLKPYEWSLSDGALPAGLILNPTLGTINGKATVPGPYTFTLQVSDSRGVTASRIYSFTVLIAPLSITTATLANASLTNSYSRSLVAAGGLLPYEWSVLSGSLPSGLTLNPTSGVITGRATTAGTYFFTVQVSDGQLPAVTATKPLSILVK